MSLLCDSSSSGERLLWTFGHQPSDFAWLDEKLDDGLDEKFGERRATILRAMAKNPSITVSDLSDLLGISRNATDKNIQFLKDKGWIKRIGPAKGGPWEIMLPANKSSTPEPKDNTAANSKLIQHHV